MSQRNNQFYYHTDHLGSATLITDDYAQIAEQIVYMPYGEDWIDVRSNGYFGSAYKFNGKEKDDETGYSYYGARYYTDRLSIWLSVDPLADKYPHLSPYAYCSDNPIMRIDPDGMADDWYESASGNITWTDCKSQQELDANGIKGTYLGQAVAVFEGSQNEKLGKGNNLFGEGAVLAKATIYGPNGVDDIKEYDAFTMSSDFSTFGAIDNGTYTVNYRNPGKGGQLKSNWAVNNTMPVDCLDGKNPNPIEGYSKTQKNGIYIHSSNRDRFAGKYYHKNGDKKGQLKGAISTGCLLIVPSKYDSKGNSLNNGWNQFDNQLKGVNTLKLILNRK